VSNLKKVLIVLFIASLTIIVGVLFSMKTENTKTDEVLTNEQDILSTSPQANKESEVEIEEVIRKETIQIAMIGDILMHEGLASYAEYTSSFSPVEAYMQQYDYLIANQESPPVANKFPMSGYPRFSSPDYIIRDLKTAGVDMLNIANNHIVDKGEEGVKTFFENLAVYDMPYVGAYQSKEDANTDRIIELKGIKVGIVSYTYGTNGLYLPQGSPYVINYIDEEKIRTDVQALKNKVDVVVAHMHWGPEFTTQEHETQRTLANLLNEAGAHIVFGTHPHVLQPYTKLTNEYGEDTHVFYSLGNYFSTTMTDISYIGGIASVEITKEGEIITVDRPTLLATANLLDSDGIYRVHPLADTENRAARNLDWVRQVLGEGVTVE